MEVVSLCLRFLNVPVCYYSATLIRKKLFFPKFTIFFFFNWRTHNMHAQHSPVKCILNKQTNLLFKNEKNQIYVQRRITHRWMRVIKTWVLRQIHSKCWWRCILTKSTQFFWIINFVVETPVMKADRCQN